MRINKKYKDPSLVVGSVIGKYQKGMYYLIDELGLKKDFKLIDNIVHVQGDMKANQIAKICSSYPT